jgi:hypothetical protein
MIMKTPVLSYCIAPPLSNWRKVAAVVLLGIFGPLAWGTDFAAEGEKQLSQNNVAKAVTYFEAALAQGAPDEKLLLDLGLAYQKNGQSADARRIFRQGADLGGSQQKTFLLDLGISAYLAQDFAGSEAAFTEAVTLDPSFAQARLNRANTRLKTQNWAGAAEDYRAYQTLAPTNSQKEKIDKVLAMLDQAASEAEAAKLAEETRKKADADAKAAADAQAVADKQKADAEAAAEKQKQDEILAKIRQSLENSSDDSKSLSTGQSGVKSDSDDFTLDN